MKICSVYLAILSFSLHPWMVRAFDWGLTLFEPPSGFFDFPDTSLSSMIRRHQQAMEDAFFRGTQVASPHYEMANDPDLFQVVLNLPEGLAQEDVHVDLNERTRMLTISGQSDVTSEETGYHSRSQFSRSFSLDPSVQTDQLTASFEEGVLTVTAPKDATKLHPTLRSIPVLSPGEHRMALPAVAEEQPKTAEPPKMMSGMDTDLDVFHIKERVEKDRQRRKEEEAAFRENPNERLHRPNKTSELRRR